MSGDMAHQDEPMDIDCIDSDFDNKENTFNHNNVLPCTEKGYEELDVSELNMKLRYSLTPAVSPMSKSFTNCTDNRSLDPDGTLHCTLNESNLTRSLNSTMTQNENVTKSLKTLPLQSIPTDKKVEINSSVLRQLESTMTYECNNVSVTSSGTSDIDENVSLPSTTSSVLHTPEATTPTKEIPKTDDSSPILRGLKSVLNMFRSSQSPITSAAGNDNTDKHETLAEDIDLKSVDNVDFIPHAMASTPIATNRMKEGNGSKRSSPYKDSIIFNDDLEKELLWKDETTIIFSQEKIPVHKLFFQQTKNIQKNEANQVTEAEKKIEGNLNNTVENLDISCNDCVIGDKTMTEVQVYINKNENNLCNDSDSEFLDCETTFTKNETLIIDNEENKLNTENNFYDLSSTLDVKREYYKSFDDNEVQVDGEVESTELIKKIIQDKSINVMIDSLDVDVNEELSFTETKAAESAFTTEEMLLENKHRFDDQQLNSSIILQLDNTKNIDENDKPMSKSEFKNNIFSEYELDSLECNLMIKANDIDMPNKNDDVLTDIINNSFTSEMKFDTNVEHKDVSVTDRNLTLLAEIPLPNEDDEDIEPNISTEVKVLMANNSNPHTVEKNTKVECAIDETTDVNLNGVSLESIPLAKVEMDGDNLTKNEQINETSDTTASIIEELNTIQTQIMQKNQVSFENNNISFGSTQLEHTSQITAEILENGDTSGLCENQDTSNYTMSQNKCSDILLYENTTKYQVPVQNEQDNVQLPNDLQVSVIENISNTEEIKLEAIDQKIENSIENVNDNIIHDASTNLNQAVVNIQSHVAVSQQITENQKDLIITTVNEENIVQKPVEDIIIVSGVNETLENMIEDEQALSNPLTDHKYSIIKEGSNGHQVSFGEDKEIINEKLPLKINYSDKMEKYETILNIDKKLSQEIENEGEYNEQQMSDKDEKVTKIENMEGNNRSLEINFISRHIEDPETFIDNITVENGTDIHERFIDKFSDLTNINNVTVEQASVSNEQQMDNNTNQNASVYMNLSTTQIKEVTVNGNIYSDINLSATHTEIQDSLVANTIRKDITDYSVNGILDIISHDDQIDIRMQEKLEGINLDTTQIKKMVIDVNLINNTNSLDKDGDEEELDTFALDEEIVLSENNSPHVSVAADLDKVSAEQILEPLSQIEDSEAITTISNSPPITSKGYNFNFDEIDDPFATKTNIRMSPTSETMNRNIQSTINNVNVGDTQMPKKVLANDRRKSHYERKKQFNLKKKLNKTFASGTAVSATFNNTKTLASDNSVETKSDINNEKPVKITEYSDNDSNLTVNNDKVESNDFHKIISTEVSDACNSSMLEHECSKILYPSETNKSMSIISCTEHKDTSSSDQSSYYSAGASSGETIISRNVFNLPEIDDMNFNPFAVKSKLCQSPPPNLDDENPFVSKSKVLASPETSVVSRKHNETQNTDSTHADENKLITVKDCEDKMDTEPMEKDTSVNKSIETCSSNASDKDSTVREINTEDEDTIEGPFLEDDDLNNDKMSCLDGENIDMMQFNDTPAQESEDNAEGELFIDAEAFEFLLNQNKSNVVADSGKESLFLKFDPLFAKRISSDSVFTALSKVQKRQSTPTKVPKHQINMSSASGPSSLNITYEKEVNSSTVVNVEDLNVTVSKPMMVVPPAVNSTATLRKSLTPARTNRRSITFTSPAMAVIDRLLSLSANNSLVENEATFALASREQNEADLALTQLRELLAEKEIHVYNLRSESKELRDRLTVLESHMGTLEADSNHRLKKINELTETLSEKTKINRSMAAVVEEYERTIASLIAETEQDKKRHKEERAALINERDEQTAHLASMEVSFNDLHNKYEKSKQVILNYKANEESYKKSLMEFEENFTKVQKNYELLKQHATSKLNHANEELQKINRAHEAEVLKLSAMIKRKDLHITSLEETLAQKAKANEELTAICDELINKVG